MNFLLLTILVAFTSSTVSAISAVTIFCHYREDYHKNYTCEVYAIESICVCDHVVTEIFGNHIGGRSNDDVVSFYSYYNQLNFFPRNLHRFFKNLKQIKIYHGGITKISQEDFAPFGSNLEVVNLAYNQIEVIEENTFKFNPNITEINLEGNKIRKIFGRPFLKLSNLRTVSFLGNDCKHKVPNLSYVHNNESEAKKQTRRFVKSSWDDPPAVQEDLSYIDTDYVGTSQQQNDGNQMQSDESQETSERVVTFPPH